MKKLKTILLFNASKYAHISFVITIFLFATKYYYLIVFGLLYLFFIYYKSKQLCMIILMVLMVVGIRFFQINQIEPETLPMKAEIIEIQGNYMIIHSKSKYLVYEDKLLDYKPGMIVYIEGHFLQHDQMNIEHNFNYSEYLKTQEIKGRIIPSRIKVISEKWHMNIISFNIRNHFDERYSKEISVYLNLFILGNKSELDDDIIKHSNSIGISHLFAISGMHLGLIVYFLNKLLNLFYLKKETFIFILTLFLLFYNIITGFSISIVRASFLLLAILLTKESRFRFNTTDYLSFIFIIFIFYNPYLIFALGFQLSFLMAYVLVLFKQFYIKKNGFKKILSISIIAMVFTLPITLSIQKSMGLLNAFINPIFIIYVGFILLPGAFLLILFPEMSHIYLYFITGFEKLIYFVSQYNILFHFNFTNAISKIIFWLILIMTFLFLKNYKKRITILWMVFIIFLLQTSFNHNSTKVVLFDVNQGDASYIQTKDCRLLIDTGNADDYNTLIQYFKGENIYYLDAIVLTHHHQDHYGEITDILSEIDIKKVYVSKIYEEFNSSIQKVVSQGDVIPCGQTQIHILNGDQGFTNENNNSLVLYTIIKGESWLFTGDIEHEIENKLIEEYHFKLDHLRVAHHGSNTSSKKSFIQHFRPKYAYISVGKNAYGFPHEEVVDALTEQVDKLYMTMDHGSLVIIYRNYYQYKYHYKDGRKIYEYNLNI